MEFDVARAQADFINECKNLTQKGVGLKESQEAILFSQALMKQQFFCGTNCFCSDNEYFVSSTPTGFAVTGYYTSHTEKGIQKVPYSITVCKVNHLWYPSKQYVAADTKSCSGSLLLWFLLCLGCTLMGLLMYGIISAAIGI